jgi:formamidopyrimidine-DNA glycosylase
MPELPEVERAARWLRARTEGRTVLGVRVLHPALGRRLGRGARARLRGRRIVGVERRGKHQFVRLDDGSALHVHFRTSGEWVGGTPEEPLPRHARLVLDLDDGWVALVDPRALATVELLAPGEEPAMTLGPDVTDPALDAAELRRRLAGRRVAIKPALLDQSVIAGVGNIYAVEGLWRARIDPRVPAARLGPRRLARLLDGLRAAIAAGERGEPFHVYGREGEACERCGHRIRRIVQAGRSTYFCPGCQRR